MANGTRRGDWRAAALAATLAFAPLVLAGCAGTAPSRDEIEVGDKESRYAQALRMAANVRAGGDQATAAMFYRRAHLLAPDRAEPLVGLAEIASAIGAREEAFGYYRQAVALDPGNAALRRGYGTFLLSMGLPEPAREMFAAAVAKNPQDHRSHNGLGVALDLIGRQAEAQEAYARGLAVAPGNASLHNNLALSLAIGGDRARAIALLQQQIAAGDLSPRVRQNLALAYALDGQMQEAVALAGRDLTQAELRNNVALYQTLPRLTPREVAAVAFGIGGPPVAAGVAAHALADAGAPATTAAVPVDQRPPSAVVSAAAAPAVAALDGVAGGGEPAAAGPRRKRPAGAGSAEASARAPSATAALPLVAVQAVDLGGVSSEELDTDHPTIAPEPGPGMAGSGSAGSQSGGPATAQQRRAVKYVRSTAMAGADLSVLGADGNVEGLPVRAADAARPALAAVPPPTPERATRAIRAPAALERRSSVAKLAATPADGRAPAGMAATESRPPAVPPAGAQVAVPAETGAAAAGRAAGSAWESGVAAGPAARAAPAVSPGAASNPDPARASIGGLGLRLVEPAPAGPLPVATLPASSPPAAGSATTAGRALPVGAAVQPATGSAATAEPGGGGGRPAIEADGDALLIPEHRGARAPAGGS